MSYARAADRGVHEGVNSRRGTWIVVLALVAGAAALALAFHAWRGVAAAREGSASVQIEQLLDGVVPAKDASGKFYADLEQHLRWQPSDARALIFKARLDMDAKRYGQAAAAFEKAVAGNSKAAKDPGVWVEYAEARAMAQGQTLAGEPLELVHKALALDANHAQALDLAGSAAWEMRNFAEAAAHWKRLSSQLPPGTVRHTELAQAIERAQRRASVSLPASHGASRQSLRPTLQRD